MGFGKYSFSDREIRANKSGYKTKSARDIFKKDKLNKDMNPLGVSIRESRDSDEHPDSVSVIIGLDTTGSMGTVPLHLVQNGLPKIMKKIMDNGVKDPQILFMGIGDHKYDSAPLQISQFESSDELLDKWLTSVYLEGGGGRNGGESYFLAWYFASRHTSIDCFEKRNKKGFLITIGDEPTHMEVRSNDMKKIVGKEVFNGIHEDSWEAWDDDFFYESKDILTSEELLKDAQKKYNVYHIHIAQTKSGKIESTIDKWNDLLGDNLIVAEKREDVADIISNIINGKEAYEEIEFESSSKE